MFSKFSFLFLLSVIILLAQSSFNENRPSFSTLITPFLDYQEEIFFEQQKENLLKLEFFYYNPLIFSSFTEDDLVAFFFLSEDERKKLLELNSKQVINSLEELEQANILSKENFDIFKNFIRFTSFSQKESPLKVEYKIGLKNKSFLKDEDRGETYQVRNLYNLVYEKNDFFLDFYLFLEKDIEEKDFFEFFKLSLAFQLGKNWYIYVGALNIAINQNLLFSTKNPTYSTYLNKNGGYRSSSKIATSKSKSEVYYTGLAVEYFWQDLTFFLFAGNYLYHIGLTSNNSLYPGLTYSKKLNFNEEKGFSIGKDTLKEVIIGFYLEYIFPSVKLSTSFVISAFSHPILRIEEPYGKESYGWSVAWDYFNPYFIFFGEAVLLIKEKYENNLYTEEKNYLLTYAFYQGVKIIEDIFSSTITLRFLDENYTAFHNNLYTAFSDKKNEIGILSSLSFNLNKLQMALTFDYARRILDESDFIFTTLLEMSWRSTMGYYFKAKSKWVKDLTSEKINFTIYNGIKKQQWIFYWKTFLRVDKSSLDTLLEINNKLTVFKNYLTSFKLGWGREEKNNISFFYFHNTLFSDFISLKNDSFWFFWGNVLFFHKKFQLELDLGFVFKTNESRNYHWSLLEKELQLSLLFSLN